MKHFLVVTIASLLHISAFAQEKREEGGKAMVPAVYYINDVQVSKAAVDKLPASSIARMNVVKPRSASTENGVQKHTLVYIETKAYAAKKKGKPTISE